CAAHAATVVPGPPAWPACWPGGPLGWRLPWGGIDRARGPSPPGLLCPGVSAWAYRIRWPAVLRLSPGGAFCRGVVLFGGGAFCPGGGAFCLEVLRRRPTR